MFLKCRRCGSVFDEWDAHTRQAEPEDGKIRGTDILICPKCHSSELDAYGDVETISSDPDYTPSEFLREMKGIAADKTEGDGCHHLWADDLMCDLLRSLGYGDGIDVYDSIRKRY